MVHLRAGQLDDRAYEGEKDYCGYPIYKDEQLRTYIDLAFDKKQQLLAHCNGDAAAEQYVSQFEKELALREDKDIHRALCTCPACTKRTASPYGKNRNDPKLFCAHTYYWGDIHLKNFGEKRGSQISPVKDAIGYDMKYTFHQDSPVIPPDMMKTVSCAVNRITRKGRSIGENQKISVLEALKAITKYGAYQYFEEDTKGTIVPGKTADFVVLDQNPLTAKPEDLADVKVLLTIKENQVVFRRGE